MLRSMFAALSIMTLFAVPQLVQTATTPTFHSPTKGSVYTEIPDVEWTAVKGATEYEVYVACTGCTTFPVSYRFTVHQPYLDFTYAELEQFLQEKGLKPNETVRIQVYVRAKVDGRYTGWSDRMYFTAKKEIEVVTPSFYSPRKGETYTNIPDVTWTNVRDASEYEVYVTCTGCTRIPVSYRFTVHQPYLDFSYAELEQFLQEKGLQPKERVSISLYVRAKVNGRYSNWSDRMYFTAKKKVEVAQPKAKISTYTYVDANGMATVYGYTDRTVSYIQISLANNVLGNRSITCKNTSYCVLTGIGPLDSGSVHYGYILTNEYMTDVIITAPVREQKQQPVEATIYTIENKDGSVTFYNYTKNREVVDTIEIYINGNVIRRCEKVTYCAYTSPTAKKVTYAIRTVHNGVVFMSDYKTYTPTQIDTPVQDTTVVPVTTQIYESVSNGKNVVVLRATTDKNVMVDRLNILVNARLARECTNTSSCTVEIPRDELGTSMTYGVNSYRNNIRYWSGYKGKNLY